MSMTTVDRKRRPRRAFTPLIAAVTLAALALGGCTEPAQVGGAEEPPERQTPVAAVEIVRRDLSRHLTTSAAVQSRSQVRLAARTSGTLEAVLFEEGETVGKGEVLARLDMAEQRAELARASAQADQARQAYERAARLRAQELISASEYDRLATELRVAESERQLWRTRLSFGEVVAPIAATVTARLVEPGEAIQSQQTLFELTAMDELVLRLGVSELDVVHLRSGQGVVVELDAMPGERLAGTVRRIFPTAEIESRLITVEVALPPDAWERGVRPGFLARVRVPIDQRADAIAVPVAAVGEAGEERYVFVIRDGRLQRRIVEIGATRGQWTEILSGLEPGEIVLATNPIDMREGQAVRIVGRGG